MCIRDSRYTVQAGIIEITLASRVGTAELAFDDPRLRGFRLIAPTGPTRGKVNLRRGTYVIYDPIPGHRQAGEQALITVT